MSFSKVNFITGTQALYNAIAMKDPNSLYFITDTQRIYKGDKECTQSVYCVTNFPTNGIEDKIYIHANTLETRVFVNGAWAVVMPGYVLTVDNLKDAANGGKLATIDAIKGYLDEILATRTESLFEDVSFDTTNGKVQMKGTDGSVLKEAELTGVAHDASYDATNLKITIPQYGKDDLVINIPHDNFLTNAYYKKDYDFQDGTVGPAIVLVVRTDGSTEDKEIAVPAASMVNDYTAVGTKTIKLSISDDHQIQASVRIDANTNDGVLMIRNASTGYIGTIGVKVNTNTAADMGDSNDVIPTAAIIAAAIRKAVGELAGQLLDDGNENEVVISTAKGIVRSGVVIGGATLSDNPTASILATEAAVMDAISWKTLA